MFKIFDIENWERRSTFEFFKDFRDPQFNMTVPVDVAAVYNFTKAENLSFSLAVLYFSLKAANSVKEFRLRMIESNIAEFETINATQTILNDDGSFSFAYFKFEPDLASFAANAEISLEKYRRLKTFDVETERLDLIYHSVIPWVSFTSFKHANRGGEPISIPRIVFGKAVQSGDTRMMPVSVEVHHALVDGFHVGEYFRILQHFFSDPAGNCR